MKYLGLSRRYFIGTSLAALVVGAPSIADAFLRRGAPPISGFSGGRSQTNFGYISDGDFPFINVLKTAGPPGFASNNMFIPPDVLDTDGYPISIVNGGPRWVTVIPSQTIRPGNYIVTWDGTGTVSTGSGGSQLGTATFTGSVSGNVLTIPGSITGTIQFGQRVTGGTTLPYTFIMSQIDATHYTVSKSQTVVSVAMTADGGSSSSSGSNGAGFLACTSADVSFVFNITSIGSPRISNAQIYHVDDAARIAAGEVFGTKFLQRIREANFGVLRFLNWQNGNLTNQTTWNTRKPITHIAYASYWLNSDYYAGTTTNSGNAYSTAIFPAIHSSDGTTWTSGGPKDKDTVTLIYNADAIQSGTVSLNVGGSGAINVLSSYAHSLASAPRFYPIGNSSVSMSTLTYSAALGSWLQQGGNAEEGSDGINNTVPPELMLRLCKEVGAHPYFISPPLAMTPATDYMPNLMYLAKTYIAANATWMIPRLEPPNEVWNSSLGFHQTSYANAVAAALWSGAGYADWYGYALANLGQMANQIFGGGLGTSYHMICGVQTHGGLGNSDERLASTQYIGQVPPADPSITGPWGTITFTKTAAKFVTSHVANAQYMSPLERYTVDELIHAYSYSVTNRANPSAQATIAFNYVATLEGAAAPFNLAYCNNAYVAWKAWAASFGVNRMCGYEGAYSPDYLLGYGFPAPPGTGWATPIIGASKASSCVLTLNTNTFDSEFGPLAGNPAVVGMTLVIPDVSGMTELNNPGLEAVTFTGGGSPNINGANTLKLNQTVSFYDFGGGLPPELTKVYALTLGVTPSTMPYYVVSTGNPFQISATRGGSPINFATAIGGGVFAQESWRITNVSGASVTIDCDSTAFSTYTSGGNAYYESSRTYSNNLRYAGKLAPNLQGYTYGSTSPKSNYQSFIDAGGEFPSNYLMAGPSPSGNVWFVLEPLTESPNQPQWDAIIAFNH